MKNKAIYDEIERVGVSPPDIDVEAQVYFGQCAEDLIVRALIVSICKREGLEVSKQRYLEIGANHPIATSATYLLNRSLGMRGVLVEPNPRLLADLQKIRVDDVILPVAVAADGSSEVQLYISNQSELSSLSHSFVNEWAGGSVGIKEVVDVDSVSINEILSVHFSRLSPMFLSLDVESLDLEILKTLDFSRWRPCLIQIEPSDFFIPGNSEAIIDFLASKHYLQVAETPVNLLFADARRFLAIENFGLQELLRLLSDDLTERIHERVGSDIRVHIDKLNASVNGLAARTNESMAECIAERRRMEQYLNEHDSRLEDGMKRLEDSIQNLHRILLPRAKTHKKYLNRAREKFKAFRFRAQLARGRILIALSRISIFDERRRYHLFLQAQARFGSIPKGFGTNREGGSTYRHEYLSLTSSATSGAFQGSLPTVCVVIHAYYLDTLCVILESLNSLPIPFRLFITTTQAQLADVKRAVRRILPHIDANTIAGENLGRNFGPMLVELSETIKEHDLLLHLHTKKSLRTGREQNGWREHIIRNLIGTPAQSAKIIRAFMEDDHLGVVGPITFHELPHWAHHWLSVQHRVPAFFERIGVFKYPRLGFLDFPVGSMFWARTDALAPLLNQRWAYSDFDPEPAPDDGTLAHLVERAIGVVATSSGYKYGEVDIDTGSLKIGASDRGLAQYFDLLSSHKANSFNYDVISFDFFDTLFTRLSVRPEDVQQFVGYELFWEGHAVDASGFLQLRKNAEAAARVIKGHGDVSLKEIYGAWGSVSNWSGDIVARAEFLEQEIESRVIIPRASVLEWARQLAQAGRRLIIISDTYFESEFLRRILRKYFVEGIFSEILASSETGLRKDNATVWKMIAIHQGASAERRLHIGDNEHSDLQLATDRGLAALGVINTAVLADLRGCPLPPLWREAQSTWQDGILLGPLVANVGSDAFFPTIRQAFKFACAREFGYLVLGPLVFAFMSWVVRRAKQDGVDCIYFMARGAFFLNEIYEEIRKIHQNLPRSKYLMVSRRAVLPAAFASNGVIDAVLEGAGFRGTFADFLMARLGVSSDIVGEDGFVHINIPEGIDVVASLLEKHREAIFACCQDARQNVRLYAQEVGLDADGVSALVDLGYSATSQKALQTVLGRGMRGYYFAVADGARDVHLGGGAAEGCFNGAGPSAARAELLKYTIVLEAFFAAPHGQVVGYERREGCADPIYGSESESESSFAVLGKVAEGMKNYCLDLISAYGPSVLYVDYDSEVGVRPFYSWLNGWGGIPDELRDILYVDDDFCGNGVIDVRAIMRSRYGLRI